LDCSPEVAKERNLLRSGNDKVNIFIFVLLVASILFASGESLTFPKQVNGDTLARMCAALEPPAPTQDCSRREKQDASIRLTRHNFEENTLTLKTDSSEGADWAAER
jgi:hypothetical protein